MPALDGQGIIVTGAAQGLGAAIAGRFAAEGARLAVMDHDGPGLEATARACGETCLSISADLSDKQQTDAAIATAFAYLGRIDTVVHNAAILVPRPFEAEDFTSFRRTVDVGLQAGFQLAHAAWPLMRQQGDGTVVFVSSRSGIEGFANEAAYCAAKHALEGVAKSLAQEGAPFGIGVFTVTPGMYMRTPMSERNYSDDLKQKWVDPMLLTTAFVRLAQRDPQLPQSGRLDAWELSGRGN